MLAPQSESLMETGNSHRWSLTWSRSQTMWRLTKSFSLSEIFLSSLKRSRNALDLLTFSSASWWWCFEKWKQSSDWLICLQVNRTVPHFTSRSSLFTNFKILQSTFSSQRLKNRSLKCRTDADGMNNENESWVIKDLKEVDLDHSSWTDVPSDVPTSCGPDVPSMRFRCDRLKYWCDLSRRRSWIVVLCRLH